MIRWFQFYRLLGIPDEVPEPTFYDILGISGAACTPEGVQRALQERRKRLRQNIPGPQFIPLVLKFESEQLEPAARVLGDPILRMAYDRELSQTKEDQEVQKKQREKVQAARQAIAEAVNPDGTLSQRKRYALAERLWEIGLSEEDVQAILLRIPSSREEPAGGADEEGMASKREFYLCAADLALAGGFLNEQERSKLLQLAENLRIPGDLANSLIDERIRFQKMEMQRREMQMLEEEFEQQVQSLHPEGAASAVQQEYLYQTGLNQGLPAERVREILRRCLALSEEGVVPKAAAEPTAREWKEPEKVSAGAGQFQDVRNVLVMIVLMILLAGGLLFLLYSLLEPREKGMPEGVPSPERVAAPTEPEKAAPAKPAPEAVEPERPAPAPEIAAVKAPEIQIQSDLLKKLLASRNSPELWSELLRNSTGGAVQGAMEEAGRILLLGEWREIAKETHQVLESLLVIPEHQAMHPQIIRSALDACAGVQDAEALCLPLKLLSKFILLTGWECPGDAAMAQQRLEVCGREWQKSLIRIPERPLRDPQRLAEAVWAGGSLDDVLLFCDEAEYTAVSMELAGNIAEAEDVQNTELFQTMVRRAKSSSVQPAFLGQAARLSLCEVLRKTRDERLAEQVFFELAELVGIHDVRAIVSSDFRSAEFRGRTAAMLESFFVIGIRPDQYREDMFPHFSKRRVLDSEGKDFRRHYSTSDRPEDILKDTAITMLASVDLCRQYSGSLSGRGVGLKTALESGDPAGFLIRAVTFIKPETENVQAEEPVSVDLSGAGTAAETSGTFLETLRQDLISESAEKRYPAISQLRQSGDIEATDILLQSLKEPNVAGHEGTVCRVLRALRMIPDQRIPQKLAELIGESESGFLRYNVVRVLREEMQGPLPPEAILPVIHTPAQQQACYAWWRGAVSGMNLRWGAGKPAYPPLRHQKAWEAGRFRSSPETAAVTGDVQEAWMEDDRPLKLLARISFYARNTADELDQLHYEGEAAKELAAIEPDSAIAIGRMQTASDLLESMKRLTGSLERLVRTHPKGKDFAMQADLLWLRHNARLAACETALQEAAVWMETQGGWLDLLRREGRLDQKGHEELVQIARQRELVSAIAPNVLYEIRENAYCNLAIWNMLAESRFSEPEKASP